MTVTLLAKPGTAPCPECDGTGELDQPLDEPWMGCLSAWDCPWCHGTGRVLTPIPLDEVRALLVADEP